VEQDATSLPPHALVNVQDIVPEHDERGTGYVLGHPAQVPSMTIETVPVPLQKTVSLAPLSWRKSRSVRLGGPCVAMVDATDSRKGDDRSSVWWFDGSSTRCITAQ
jgi:hypothetical protein